MTAHELFLELQANSPTVDIEERVRAFRELGFPDSYIANRLGVSVAALQRNFPPQTTTPASSAGVAIVVFLLLYLLSKS